MSNINTLVLRRKTNLLTLVEADGIALRRVAGTRGGEWAGPCPFCGGRDRFRVQPNREAGGVWFCRQCTGDPDSGGRWHDVIAYVQKRDGVDFQEAARRLGADELSGAFKPARPAQHPKVQPGVPAADWQQKARNVIETCERLLWGDQGGRALDWLHARGLNDDTLRRWHIGYNLPNGDSAGRTIAGLWVWEGITIPYFAGDRLWAVNVRRPERIVKADPKEAKYIMLRGSRRGLFGADNLNGVDVAMLTEGEFDAMLLYQEAGDLAGVATLGNATARLNLDTWAAYLFPVTRFLVAYDVDGAGRRGADALLEMSARMHRASVPRL